VVRGENSRVNRFGNQPIQEFDLQWSERHRGLQTSCEPIEHRHPKDAPTEDAECRHNRPARTSNSVARCLKMSVENLDFTDAIAVQESIGRLGVCPVLADQGDAVARTRPQLLQ
jgi:hypothetical protein